MERACGVLLPIFSLPSKYGIGCFSKEAYEFVDFLSSAGQTYWQILPLGPTSYGDSPYQAFSTFAGNPYFIDLEQLIELKWITKKEADSYDFGSIEANGCGYVDYEKIYNSRFKVLKKAYKKSNIAVNPDYVKFVAKNKKWLDNYALYMAIKDANGSVSYLEWDEDIRLRKKTALKEWSDKLKDEVEFYKFQQFLFYTQWKKLKSYANSKGIKIVGDIPIYVSLDSADTWANPELFQLDDTGYPTRVAGCPPDCFSDDGQLWGNPLYNWHALRKSGYKWWLERLHTAGELYDMVRIDHFIGFANYYAVKAGAKNARVGKWEKAPGFSFFKHVRRACPELTIIAEDLGVVSKRVKRLLRFCGYPGMKVLSFGFDGDETNPHFPENIFENCVFYTGTHDNDTSEGWWKNASENAKELAKKYLPPRDSIHEAMIEEVLSSRAETAIIPMQDVLGLSSEGRMNTPGTVGSPNWRWRMKPGDMRTDLAMELRDMNEFFERNDL